jgi:phosphate-selective porin
MKKLLTLLMFMSVTAYGQTDTTETKDELNENKSKKWYDNINVRGYMQVRYNRLFESNPQLKCDQCDKSWGEGGGIFIRRTRVILYGQIHERVYFYIQPDFASSTSSNALNIGQLRDAYVDIGFDRKNEFRVRLGQSKIPFGFENMQSSQNRLPLDRDDALNSAFSNERDLAAFFYWAPTTKRRMFSTLVNEGYKGEGDYGIIAFGAFNGQTANKPDQNNQLHVVGRITYPFQWGTQVIEPSIQAYTGKYVVTADQLSPGVKIAKDNNYQDQRVAATFVLYPRPFGIQAEYNIGKGPEFNKETDSIEVRSLRGGYATFNYMLKIGKQLVYPFVRAQYYRGGKKFETDARSYSVDELNAGIEWQPFKNFELVGEFVKSKRRFEDFKNQDNLQEGHLFRLQAQLNF